MLTWTLAACGWTLYLVYVALWLAGLARSL